MNKNQLSLLICVCPDDSEEYFNLALRSVTEHQSKKPNEVIIVLDGSVSTEIIKIIDSVFNTTPIKHHIIKNEIQMGLAYSLNRGLKFCSNDWIARMDADDIALPDRFSTQLDYVRKNPSIAVLGSSIREFGDNIKERDKIAISNPIEIKQKLKYKNPINHPSCIFNRLKILSVGGYPQLEKNQDYGLWLTLFSRGYELANLDKVLLRFRITDNFYSKRGIRLLKHDIKIIFLQKRLNLISFLTMLFLITARTFFRVLPPYFLKLVYSISRKNY